MLVKGIEDEKSIGNKRRGETYVATTVFVVFDVVVVRLVIVRVWI